MIIYIICLVFGLIFTLFSAVAGHLFGGHAEAPVGTDGQADSGFGSDGVPGLSLLSPTVLATFGLARRWPLPAGWGWLWSCYGCSTPCLNAPRAPANPAWAS